MVPFDILPSGHKAVRHVLVLEPAPGVALPPLVAHPVRGFHGATAVRAGEPFAFSTKYGTRLYSLAAGENVPAEIDDAWLAGHASTAIPVSQVASVPILSPTEEVRTTLVVEGVEGGVLRLRAGGEGYASSASAWALLVALALIAVAGVFGLVRLARRARSRSSAST